MSNVDIRIVGVVLARNEERFIRSAIENVLPSCDEVLVFEHDSKDATLEILREIEAEEPKVRVERIKTPAESHAALEHLAGTNTWVFAVDGDEIYDPERTLTFTNELRQGAYSGVFQIKGNVLHVDEWKGGECCGFFGPPSRAMNKLYNFALIDQWTGGFERLHGGEIVFREELLEAKRVEISNEFGFDDSPFRCLHLVFLKRSSWSGDGGVRPNIADRIFAGRLKRLWWGLKTCIGFPVTSPGKLKNYRLGDHVSRQVKAFQLREFKG